MRELENNHDYGWAVVIDYGTEITSIGHGSWGEEVGRRPMCRKLVFRTKVEAQMCVTRLDKEMKGRFKGWKSPYRLVPVTITFTERHPNDRPTN